MCSPSVLRGKKLKKNTKVITFHKSNSKTNQLSHIRGGFQLLDEQDELNVLPFVHVTVAEGPLKTTLPLLTPTSGQSTKIS